MMPPRSPSPEHLLDCGVEGSLPRGMGHMGVKHFRIAQDLWDV